MDYALGIAVRWAEQTMSRQRVVHEAHVELDGIRDDDLAHRTERGGRPVERKVLDLRGHHASCAGYAQRDLPRGPHQFSDRAPVVWRQRCVCAGCATDHRLRTHDATDAGRLSIKVAAALYVCAPFRRSPLAFLSTSWSSRDETQRHPAQSARSHAPSGSRWPVVAVRHPAILARQASACSDPLAHRQLLVRIRAASRSTLACGRARMGDQLSWAAPSAISLAAPWIAEPRVVGPIAVLTSAS